jgi:ParB-like nuclease family protein
MLIRNRIKALRHVRAGDLRPNPRNWRRHPKAQQDALRGILAEVGYVDALIVRELPDGGLEIVDGHLRAETTPDTDVPVLVVDLTDAEAAKVLATFNPLAGMAETDPVQIEALLREVETESDAVAKLLADLHQEAVDRHLADLESGDATDEEPDDGTPPEFVAFRCPVTVAQEQVIRKAIRAAKAKFSVDATGEALSEALKEWLNGQDE